MNEQMNSWLDEYMTIWKKLGDKVTKVKRQEGKEHGREDCRLWVWWLSTKEWRISKWPQAWDYSQLGLVMWPTEICQIWPSDGFAVDFVMHPFIGWAINWSSMGLGRRLTSENEWGVLGRKKRALFPTSDLLSHPQPCKHYDIILQSHA